MYPKAVPSAAKCLKGGGRFCSFSPCIEQIQKTADELQKNGFICLRTMECLSREHSVKTDNLIVDLEAYQREQEQLRGGRKLIVAVEHNCNHSFVCIYKGLWQISCKPRAYLSALLFRKSCIDYIILTRFGAHFLASALPIH